MYAASSGVWSIVGALSNTPTCWISWQIILPTDRSKTLSIHL
jgi:hypothetical protein